MGARAVMPQEKVKQLLANGLTNIEIVNVLRDEDHLVVDPSTISKFKSRLGLNMRRYGALPWRLPPEHKNLYLAMMMRFYVRRQAGQTLTPHDDSRLDVVLEFVNENDAVISYQPKTQDVFVFVPRRDVDGPKGATLWEDPTHPQI